MKNILVLFPKNTREGQPSFERVSAFRNFYVKQGFSVHEAEHPTTLKEKLTLFKLINSTFGLDPNYLKSWKHFSKNIYSFE